MACRSRLFGLGAGCATVVAVAVVGVLGRPEAAAVTTGEPGPIAFERETAGNVDIYVVPDPPLGPTAPVPSVNATPGTPGSRDTNPSWAKKQGDDDLPLLAFDSDRSLNGPADRDREIYLLELDPSAGSPPAPTALTDNAGIDDSELAWAGNWPANTPVEQ